MQEVDDRFSRGIRLFNEHDFFSCHDAWEELWMETSGNDRRFLQCLIQVAVGYYHAGNANSRGATNLLSKGIEKLKDYEPVHLGLDLQSLLPRFEAHRQLCARAIAEGAAQPPLKDSPRIEYTLDNHLSKHPV
jgi:predicted metal-dependent hydrolase